MAGIATVDMKIGFADEAFTTIMDAIKGTGDNQVILMEMVMNNSITLVRIVNALKNWPQFNYSSEVMHLINSIDLDVLSAQIVNCDESLKNIDALREENGTPI